MQEQVSLIVAVIAIALCMIIYRGTAVALSQTSVPSETTEQEVRNLPIVKTVDTGKPTVEFLAAALENQEAVSIDVTHGT